MSGDAQNVCAITIVGTVLKIIWREIFGQGKPGAKNNMAASLYVEESIESWKRTYELYKEILERKADKQKKDKAKKLLELDHW